MKLGDSGSNIKELQELLISQGFSLKPDGHFGPATQKAVKDFQTREGLVPDGVVGKITLAKLEGPKNHEPEPPIKTDFDARTQENFNTLDPKAKKIFLPFILEAKKIAAGMGFDYIAISGNRTYAQQNEIYAQGRTKPGPIVTRARGGFSNHNFAIALDFGVFKDGTYLDKTNPVAAQKVHAAVSKLISKYKIDWGGNWSTPDIPHFEIRTGLSIAAKRALFEKGGSVLE